MPRFTSEEQLKAPLLEWLQRRRRFNEGTYTLEEMPWFNRKIDLVTISPTRLVTAYELKLNSFRRAVEQAAYNRMAFDRAYVVTASRPSDKNLSLAIEAKVGVILVTEVEVVELVVSPLVRSQKEVRRSLLSAIRGYKEDVSRPVFALP